jgi:hypothetical protein
MFLPAHVPDRTTTARTTRSGRSRKTSDSRSRSTPAPATSRASYEARAVR